MKEILACLIASIASWIYFFYERRKLAKKKVDWMEKLWYDSLDLKVLMCAIAFSIFTIYLLIVYLIN